MKQEQLQKTLDNLVTDFGYENVRKTLGEMRSAKTVTATPKKKSGNAVTAKSGTGSDKKRSKPNAMKIIRSLVITDAEKKEILFILAKKYEAKEFMPNVNHARDFLSNDRDVSRIKSRQQVTSAIFKKLYAMETTQLQEILGRGLYGPRKRLESYARAIEGFSRPSRHV